MLCKPCIAFSYEICVTLKGMLSIPTRNLVGFLEMNTARFLQETYDSEGYLM